MLTDILARPIAHRGYHDRASGVIENSRSAFEAAIAKGFGIECDLQLTADGVPVVFHDDDLKRLLGIGGSVGSTASAAICATPLLGSAASDCPQSFAVFLSQIEGRAPLIVELKRQANEQRGHALAKKAFEVAQSYPGPLAFKSFDPDILQGLHQAGYRGPSGIVTYGYDRPEWEGQMSHTQKFVLRNLLHWPWSRFTFISCEQGALGLGVIRLLRWSGIKVMSWTVKDPAKASRVLNHADQIVFEGFDPD